MWFAKRFVVGLIVLALPVQGLAVATADLRAPAHYHDELRSADQRATSHAHGGVEHHFHAADEGAIEVVEDDDHHHETAALEQGAAKKGSSGAFDTVLHSRAILDPHQTARFAIAGKTGRFPPLYPDRLERPPKFLPRANS